MKSRKQGGDMGKGFFKNTLAGHHKPEDQNYEKKTGPTSHEPSAAPAPRKRPPQLFDDVTVCSYLKCRRRILNDARKASARGRDWDCVNLHAGMTKTWIDDYALKNGILPNFNVHLEPIKADTNVVSVRLIGGHPSREICLVERLADGERHYARVRNQDIYPIHLQECFDCLDIEGHLEWTFQLNAAAY